MLIGRVRGCNFTYTAPADMENCQDLHVRVENLDGQRVITSAWFPTKEEIALMQEGQPIHLHIYGSGHPVVAMSVPRD